MTYALIDVTQLETLTERLAALEQAVRESTQRDDRPKPGDWLSVAEYAKHRDVTTRTVHNWIKDGQVEARGAGKLREVKV